MISIVFVCVAIEQKIDQDMGVLFFGGCIWPVKSDLFRFDV